MNRTFTPTQPAARLPSRLPSAMLSRPLTLPMTQPPPDAVRTLHPGDVVCAERGESLDTLLGSCVAVILTDPRRTLGAMCHIVHAGHAAAGAAETSAYGHAALGAMDTLLRVRGINPALCVAYVYGGGNMFPGLFTQSHVGETNARWTLDALAQRGVQVIAQDLGGRMYRRLRWTVGTDAPQVTCVPV
jgi:chemotaxis protein CheD